MSKVVAEHLRKALAKSESNLVVARSNLPETKANMIMARADLELEKQKRKAKAVATKEKLK